MTIVSSERNKEFCYIAAYYKSSEVLVISGTNYDLENNSRDLLDDWILVYDMSQLSSKEKQEVLECGDGILRKIRDTELRLIKKMVHVKPKY